MSHPFPSDDPRFEPDPDALGLFVLGPDDEPRPARSVEEWGRFFQFDPRRFLRQTRLNGDGGGHAVLVSTVFLGIGGDPAPALWETMILGGPMDGHRERHVTRGSALAGHARALALAVAPDPTVLPGNG